MEAYLDKLQNQLTSSRPSLIAFSVFAALGLSSIACKYLLPPVYGFYRHFLRPRRNLQSLYGQQTWAVVTGASSGIGEAYCELLAQRGFNVVLIARNKDTMEQIAQGLRNRYGVQASIISFDFCELRTEEGVNKYFNLLKDVTENLDVSILVNNAGKAHLNKLEDHSL